MMVTTSVGDCTRLSMRDCDPRSFARWIKLETHPRCVPEKLLLCARPAWIDGRVNQAEICTRSVFQYLQVGHKIRQIGRDRIADFQNFDYFVLGLEQMVG